MNYGNIIYYDIANGPGIRTSLFVSGCRHHCKNCFNPDTWDFNYGKPFTKEEEFFILDSLTQKHIQGVTILGGEPLEPENQPAIAKLVKKIKENHPDKDIWLYTGCVYENLFKENNPYRTPYLKTILKNIDVMVDGPYIDRLRNPLLAYRGSENQRILNIPETIRKKSIVEAIPLQ